MDLCIVGLSVANEEISAVVKKTVNVPNAVFSSDLVVLHPAVRPPSTADAQASPVETAGSKLE